MSRRINARPMLRGAAVAAAQAFALGWCLTGCQFGNHGEWHGGEGGAGGTPAGGAPTCDDDCATPPEGWSPPVLVGVGSFTAVPSCPDVAPFEGINLYSDLQALSPICPACQCAGSETGCSIPAAWHASAADCAGAEGAESTPWDGQAGWGGACAPGGIPAGASCGGVPCVQSLTVEAPVVTAGPCTPVAPGRPYSPPHTWGRRARECLPAEAGTCPEEPGQCFPPPGFSLCVHHPGDVECPAPYTEKEVFHRDVADERACSPCECGAPAGNVCTVLASAFQDGACSVIAGALLVTSESGDGCVDVPPGLALGGKTAEIVATGEGVCAPIGGEPVGAVEPVQPVTVCCRQELTPR